MQQRQSEGPLQPWGQSWNHKGPPEPTRTDPELLGQSRSHVRLSLHLGSVWQPVLCWRIRWLRQGPEDAPHTGRPGAGGCGEGWLWMNCPFGHLSAPITSHQISPQVSEMQWLPGPWADLLRIKSDALSPFHTSCVFLCYQPNPIPPRKETSGRSPFEPY